MSGVSTGSGAVKKAKQESGLWAELARLARANPVDVQSCMKVLDAIAEVGPGAGKLDAESAIQTADTLVPVIDGLKKEKPLVRINRLRAIAAPDWMPRKQQLRAIVAAGTAADIGGRAQELLELSTRQLELADPATQRKVVMNGRFRLAMAHYCLSRPLEALTRLDSLVLEIRDDDQALLGMVETNRACIFMTLGRIDEALAAVTKADRINRATGRTFFVCGNLLLRANILKIMGEVPAALELLVEMEEVAFALGERPMMGVAIGAQGDALATLGRVDEAMEHCKRAAEIFREFDDQRSLVVNRTSAAHLLYRMGRTSEAEVEFQGAAEDARRNGMIEAYLSNVSAIINLRLTEGDVRAGRDELQQAEAVLSPEAPPHERLIFAEARGRVLCAEGQHEPAIDCLLEAIEIAEPTQNVQQLIKLRTQLAEVRLAAGLTVEAIEDAQAAHEAAERSVPRNDEGLLRASWVWARCAHSMGDADVVRALVKDMDQLGERLKPSSIDAVRLDADVREFVRLQRAQ
jgi:tetratricopeptide (TPR) repeat protein